MEDEDLGSRRERIFSLSTGGVRARVFDRFLFDTPFTKNGKTQGGLEDQWKRRKVLQTVGSFPALVNRLLVIKSESLEFSPVENAIESTEDSSRERCSTSEQRSAERLHGLLVRRARDKVTLPRTSAAHRALLEFMAVCKRAIRIHARLIGDEDQEFHMQLVNGFQSLTAELSHYIPAILSEL
ncbi:hypothetical protein MLD38_026271 [Melastoma candidum]|uniref:Uncharacterized protein n=1 Tax=Melastoma candidum TaxID=119954 RepID=A0ACB9P1J7_9MYRT|nr:hypothetical protein MLD38_026271 [Melastoma candidum]